MQTLNANQYSRGDNPVWCFLAEFSLNDFFVDRNRKDELTSGLLFQAVRELGMSPEWAEYIEMTLAESATETLAHSKQGTSETPWRIRVFCQKKIIDDANLTRRTSRPYNAEQVVEQVQTVLDPGMKQNGGWGYFLIERGEDFPPNTSQNPHNCIDLYLYKEGE